MRFLRMQLGVVLAALIVFSLPTFAQLTSGNVTGTVFDPTSATVPGATVVARNTATGVENTTTSTSAGGYRFENLPIGTYTISVTAPGFTKAEVENVRVELNATVTANLTLAIGQATTSVQVTEATAPIDTTTAQVQTLFESKQIAD